VAVVCGLSAVRQAHIRTRPIWVAARDLTGGEPLARADLRVEQVPLGELPTDAMSATAGIVGRLLAAPMRRGEPFTDVRLLSPALISATGEPGAVAVPVRVADGAAALALVHPGDVVDVLAAPDPDSGVAPPALTVVRAVRVLAVPPEGDSPDGGSDGGGLVIVETTPVQAAALARATSGARLSLAVRAPQ
jgi:Flp pilus assembly protein CpaB